MGFTIFESSGTFNPLDYGLVVGDMIHLVVVGGGGGGCGAANNYTPGTAGSASSFGNILTAAGGLAPSDNQVVSATPGSFLGAPGQPNISMGVYYDNNVMTSVSGQSVYAGGGADGWLPGICKGRSGLPSTVFAFSPMLTKVVTQYFPQDEFGHIVNFAFGSSLLQAIPASNQKGGSGGLFLESGAGATGGFYVLAIAGAGGIGYGAGGGGGCCRYYASDVFMKAGAGGNSGVIAQKDHVLTSTSPISVTVGDGGKGGSGYAGGAGANGCVAIFW